MTCDHCGKPLGVSVIYDHGKRYHTECYIQVAEQKMKDMVRKTVQFGEDWSMGKYET